MQEARNHARELEQALSRALDEYLRFDYSNHLVSTEQGRGKLLKSNGEELMEKLQAHIERMEGIEIATSQGVSWNFVTCT